MKQETILLSEIPNHINGILFENRQLKAENEDLKSKSILFDKYHGKAWTTKMVAELHDIHEATVRKYVKAGIIITHPKSTDAKILIRASVAMQLDFDQLRKQYRAL